MVTIHNQDCLKGLRKLSDSSVDLVVTSPPYKDCDGFSYGFLNDVFSELYRVQKDNALFFLNFGHLAEDKMRPFNVCGCALGAGYKLNDTVVWLKNHYRPIQGKKRLNNLTEFIFLLYKGEMPSLDRLAIGIPYKDKTNAKRFNGGKDLRCRGNLWEIPYETIQSKNEKLHNDRFPLELPEMCIRLAGLPPGGLICDPFTGSGTSGLVARNLGHSFIGFEINTRYFEIAKERLK